jgi:membrane associated rhomboid family serine protease
MIPLKSLTPRTTIPVITLLLIAVNVIVFFNQLSMSPRMEQSFVMQYGMVPAHLQVALTNPRVPLASGVIPLFTSMFLHGGWLHILGNMWFLWVFGASVEDRLGHLPYLFLYLVCGLGAGVAQTIVQWGSQVPSIGASGAISGVMAAYLVLFPGAQILTLVPLLIIFFTVRLPALLFIGYWFLLQLVSGLNSLQMPGAGGGVGWWAHIGGFILGILLVAAIPRRPPAPSYY